MPVPRAALTPTDLTLRTPPVHLPLRAWDGVTTIPIPASPSSLATSRGSDELTTTEAPRDLATSAPGGISASDASSATLVPGPPGAVPAAPESRAARSVSSGQSAPGRSPGPAILEAMTLMPLLLAALSSTEGSCAESRTVVTPDSSIVV